jgi:asparagine synthase (glutamine-hydrolysing)
VERPNSELSLNAISSILTLRYNYDSKPRLPKLFWNDFQTTNSELSLEFIENAITESMKNSIKEDTKKVSISLSAGIDSTLMLALFKKEFPDIEINAISMRFADSTDETLQASKIAEYFGIEHHIIDLENFLIELPAAINITKQPFWDLHWYHIVKKAKSLSNYLISGDGGDELFGGYTFRYQKYFSLISASSDWNKKVECYLRCHERDWVPDQEELFGTKIDFSWEKIHSILKPYFDNPLPELEKIFLADYNGKLLYNFSPVNSSFHDYFNINSIVPLLSKKIISYATHLDPRLKYDPENNIGKIPLRKILSKYIKNEFINQKKQGFSVNTINLWKNYGFDLCEKYVINGNICNDDWINKKWIKKYFKENLQDVRYINKFLGLLAFEIWYRIFITKEMKPDTKLTA